MKVAIGYWIAGNIGFLIGVIATCILLAKKNAPMKDAVDKAASDRISMAKAAYKYYSQLPEDRISDESEDEEGADEQEQEI